MAGSRSGQKGLAIFSALSLCSASACSLFVSVDDLNDGSGDGGAGSGALDAATLDASSGDANDGASLDAASASDVDAHVSSPPQFRVLTTQTNAGGNAMTIARAAQIQPGDIMIALVYQYVSGSTSTPPDATWASITGFDDPGPSYHVDYYWRRATASEPSSYVFTATTGQYAEVDLIAYSGASTAKWLDDGNSTTYRGVASYGTPALATTSANDTIVISAVADGQGAAVWSAPANVTPRKPSGYVFFGDTTQTSPGSFPNESIGCAVSAGVSSGGIGLAAIKTQ